MNITGIRPYEAIGYARVQQNSDNLVVNSTKADYLEDAPVTASVSSSSVNRQTQTAYDFAMKYDPNATYELKGKDSDLASLDKMNKLPESHKDQALKQYHTFVGNLGNKTENVDSQEKSNARQLENFTFS